MSSRPSDSQQSFLPTTLILPDLEEKEEFNYILTDFIKKMISATNDKDIGQYALEEVQNGQKFFDAEKNNAVKNVYRKVIDFGSLPNNSTKEINHGITITEEARFTRIYGTASNPDTSFIPLPFASPIVANNISLEVTTTVVRITTAIDYSAYIDTFIILEYLKAT